MIKMYPSYISPDVKSAAERKLYEAIKQSSAFPGIVCLHSLGLSKHVWKKQGEIDFVVIGNGMVLCLEVKGGRIKRKDGVWYFIDRYGQESKKTESPFAQASSGMFSLKANIESKFGHTGLIFGYGVMMPDIRFDVDSPEWDQEIVYDLRDSRFPFDKYVRRLQNYWEKKVGISSSGVDTSGIVKYLRGDFELAIPLWKEIQDTESQMTEFSAEQYRALDQMEDNPRLIFSGGAGSGKTLLAVEKARRAAFGGKSVLLLCYNKLLGAKLQDEISKFGKTDNLVIGDSIHKYFAKVISAAGLREKLDRKIASVSQKEAYDEAFASVFMEAAAKNIQKKFDLIVIDEGQDLLNDNYLLAIESILEGGMQKGEWVVFLDPGAQARLFNKFSKETYSYLKSLGASEYKLDMNCRNTLQIAAQASVVSGFPVGKPKISGPKVEFISYKEDAEQAVGILSLIKRLTGEEGVPPECITILSTRARQSMSLTSSGVKLPAFLKEMDEHTVVAGESGRVYFTSVQSYKGLENNVIIYTDVDRLDGDWVEGVNYVGMTRPREKLYVFMHKKLASKYQNRIIEYANKQ